MNDKKMNDYDRYSYRTVENTKTEFSVTYTRRIH